VKDKRRLIIRSQTSSWK